MFTRLAAVADVSAIMGLIKEVVPLMQQSGNYQWDDTYPNAEVFKADIGLSQLWVADINGDIAGVAAITTDQEPEYAAAGWDINEMAIVTHRLAVSLRYQGRGIAAALLDRAEQEAIRQGINVLRIDTNSENAATQKLFPKMDYACSGEITLSFRPGLRFLCYEKRLV